MNTHSESLLVTKAEAAQLLGVSLATISRIVARGGLEEIRLPTAGQRPFLRRQDVVALASRSAVTP